MTNKKPWSFFINRRPISWLIILTILALGTFSLNNIPREIQPEVTIPFGSVSTILPGASPEDVEVLITDPLEQSISTIDGLKSMTSSSGLGISIIAVEFEVEADLGTAIQDLKDKVDSVKSELPEDATEPMVLKAEANATSIINFSVASDRPLHETTKIAEDIQEELKKISGVSRVQLAGGQKEQIKITVNQTKSENYGVALEDIATALRITNFNLPIGIISTDKINYSVRIDNRFTNIEEISNTPLFSFQDTSGTTLLLKDIAKVEKTYSETAIISKLSSNGEISERNVSLMVYKKDGGNVIKIADKARETIEELQKTLPDDINIIVSNDNSEFIKTDLGILTRSGLQTTILIIIILFLALGFKEGILAGLSIPLTLFATVIVLDMQGMTINSLTLFSLVIALGLMVDTAIVIMEGIHENIRKGLPPKEAAIKSVETYKWPLIAGTMTTVFAFFPMLLVSGILGEFLKALPITISAALLSSIFISLTVIPSVAVKFIKNKTEKSKSIMEPFFLFLGRIFEKLINKLVHRRSLRVITVFITLGLFILSLSLPITGALSVEMFPKTDFRLFIINIETPKGVILEETEKIVHEIEGKLYAMEEVDNFLTIIGSSQSQAPTDLINFGAAEESNLANITLNLVDEEFRDRKSYEIAQELREELENFKGADIFVQELTEGPPSDAPITIRITGKDIKKLKEIASDIQNVIANTPQTQNIRISLKPGLNEFKFVLDREQIAYHGLSVQQIASKTRNAIQGIEASEVKFGDDELEIHIEYDIPKSYTIPNISIKTIEDLEIKTPKGYSVTLGQLGKYDIEESPSSISHEEQDRIIKVRSDVEGTANPVLITQQIQAELDNYDLPTGYNIKFGGDTEDIEKSFQELFQSMIVGIILIGATLVLMFNSLKQPLIILLSLPLALIGVFPGLTLIGQNLSFPAFLGVVALVGVVVNDSIILIDRINNNRKKGVEFRESISEAAKARLQPIFMTSITTIIGILPLALTNEFWSGLGFSLIFGLAFSTLLILIVIPILYYMIEGRQARKHGEIH